jgi:hypothetical protein
VTACGTDLDELVLAVHEFEQINSNVNIIRDEMSNGESTCIQEVEKMDI